MTADCDLEQDHAVRFPTEELRADAGAYERRLANRLLSHVLLCDAVEEANLVTPGGDVMRRITQNQDVRYHRLPAAPIGDGGAEIPDLYFDFLRTFGYSLAAVYSAIEENQLERRALVPHTYVHDLVQRFFAFHSRIGVDE